MYTKVTLKMHIK